MYITLIRATEVDRACVIVIVTVWDKPALLIQKSLAARINLVPYTDKEGRYEVYPFVLSHK